MEFDVLGPLRARRGDESVRIGPPQHETVLAALLVDAGRAVDVDLLVRRVWDDRPPANAVASLHAIISRLRKSLATGDESLIETAAPGYRLVVDATDEGRFAALVSEARRSLATGRPDEARGRVKAALDLWRGRPYEGIRADFAEAEVTRLGDHRLAAVELAAELDLELGRHLELLETLPDEVAAHPLREGLRASLLVALYRSGRQADALRHFEQVRVLLRDELGADPGPELARLHARILAQDPDLAAFAPTSALATPPPADEQSSAESAPSITEDGLVGRGDELDTCLRVLTRAHNGATTAAVVVGEAGIGKTRLVEEVATRAATDMAVAWGRCFDHDGSPAYWPWTQALVALADQFGPQAMAEATDGNTAVAVLVPGLASDAPTDAAGETPQAAKGRLFGSVVGVLRSLARHRPIVLVLEDLHWADAESGELTEFVLSTLHDAAVAVLVTVRTPSEDPLRSGDELLGALTRLRNVTDVRLRGLGVDDVRRYAAHLGREIDVDAAGRLHARTSGNPFYIGELVRLVGEERRTTGSGAASVPGSVRAVVERRLRHLGSDTRTVLTVAAVVGRALDLRVIADVTGFPLPRLAAALDPATAAGVIVADPEQHGRWVFAHALVQDVLAEATGPMHVAVLHAQIAEAIERRHEGALDDVAASLAHHHFAAGDLGDQERAARASMRAAQVAQQQYAFAEAERHLSRALQLAVAVGGRTAVQLELEARVQLGSLLTLQVGYNDPAVAEQRNRALELARDAGSSIQLQSALWGVWGIALVSGDFAAADGFAEQLLTAARDTGDPMLQLAGTHARGQVRYHQGRLHEARDDLQAAWQLAEQHAADVVLEIFIQHPLVTAPAWLATVQALLGDVATADATAATARSSADRLGHVYTSGYLEILEGWRAMFLRRGDDALGSGVRGTTLAAQHGFDQLAAFALTPLGWGRAATGDTTQGLADVRLGNELFSALPAGHMFGPAMLATMADIHLMIGDAAAALSLGDDAVAEADRTGERFYLVAAHLARAEALQRTSAPSEQVAQALASATDVIAEQDSQLFASRVVELAGLSTCGTSA